MVDDMTDDEIWQLQARRPRLPQGVRRLPGRHRAQRASRRSVLAKTVKGYGLGADFEARNATHQMKKMTAADLKDVPGPAAHPDLGRAIEADAYQPPYYHPGRTRRRSSTCRSGARQLGGYVPERRDEPKPRGAARATRLYDVLDEGLGQAEAPPPWPSSGWSGT